MLTKGETDMPTIKIIDKKPAKRLRVAAYCRVSTSDTDQLASLDNQKKHYEKFIKANTDWEFAGVYSDDGISGRSADKRKAFQQMISDAMDGKIDYIFTKSISRFARNTIDCLDTARKLAAKGVYITFEQDNISTRDMNTELYMSIVSALAENESRSLSENVKWGIQKRFQDGTYKVVSPPYGYHYQKGNIEIYEDKAEVVKQIFAWGLDGQGGYTIARRLNEAGIPSPRGRKWNASTINNILRNRFYTGDVIFQSTFTAPDGKRRKNNNNIDSYLCEEHHEAIISLEMYEKVQKTMDFMAEAKAGVDRIQSTKRYVYSGKIYCNECNASFKHKIQHTGDKVYPIFACSNHIRDKSRCSMKAVKEAAFKDAFCTMVNKLMYAKNRVLKPMLEELNSSIHPSTENNNELERLEAQESMLHEMMEKHDISSSVILPELIKIRVAKEELCAAEKIYSNDDKKGALKELISVLDREPLQTEFSEHIFSAIVNKAVIVSKKQILFELKCGLRLEERLVRA